MKTLRYFSTFTGIAGFELGIEYALHTTNRSKNGKSQEDQKNESEKRQGLESAQGKRNAPANGRSDRGTDSEPYTGSLCVGFSEIDPYACQLLQNNYPTIKNYGDITKINERGLPDFELFVGGFPCQSFSIAGKRRGFEDTRGTLFFEIVRILKEKQPRLLLLENVKGLLSHSEGSTFLTIITALDELGYDLQWQVLNSKNHGVPQNRERIFIVGHLRGTPRPEVFPIGESDSVTDGKLKVIRNSTYDTDRLYDPSGIARTMRANAGGKGAKTGLYKTGEGIRRLTPTECERLQGFPDGWTAGFSDTQRYKMLGNAVTVNVIRDIIIKLFT